MGIRLGKVVAVAALAEVDGEGEEATARELVARRLRTMDGLERHVRMRRLVAMLGRKGYSTELAVRVVTELVGPDDDLGGGLEDEPRTADVDEPGLGDG